MLSLFVPGRLCLFGEHADWAGEYRRSNPTLPPGVTLICGTDQGVYARVAPLDAPQLRLKSTLPDGRTYSRALPLQPDALRAEARRGDYWSYIAGTAYQVLRRYPVGGLTLHNDRTDLPVQKGLSSSAAICVLTARAFNRVYDLGLTLRDEMELAYLGEITTPSRCGRMDQGCAFGRAPTLMTFDADRMTAEPVPVGGRFHLLLVDLGAHKDTQRILADLNACYPDAPGPIAAGVRRLLGPVTHTYVRAAADALAAGDAPALGRLMTDAQAQFDRYATPACPAELTAPILHRVLNDPALQPHIYGGKGVGSQGDGAAQFVARSAADRDTVRRLIAERHGMSTLTLTIKPTNGNHAPPEGSGPTRGP